ncbi:MAG: hypothetical protein LBP83_06175, partial [Dysgonamonadaceae bacterium]|nr:hypothetical protein [Dysgonamonadaceae bacterium]
LRYLLLGVGGSTPEFLYLDTSFEIILNNLSTGNMDHERVTPGSNTDSHPSVSDNTGNSGGICRSKHISSGR